MSCLSRCPYFRGVLNEGFRCNTQDMVLVLDTAAILNSDLVGSGVGAGLDDDHLMLLEVQLVDQSVVVCRVQLGERGQL